MFENETDELRERRLTICLEPAAADAIVAAARRADRSTSSWLRRAALAAIEAEQPTQPAA